MCKDQSLEVCLIERTEYQDRGYRTPCRIWTGLLNPDGYGISYKRRAHIEAWELVNGPVPKGLELDHLCFQRDCCEETHLEAVTYAENIRRSVVARRLYKANWTHCQRSHELSGTNLRFTADGRRICKECAKLSRRRARNGTEELKSRVRKAKCIRGHDLLDPINRLASRGCRQCTKDRRYGQAKERMNGCCTE